MNTDEQILDTALAAVTGAGMVDYAHLFQFLPGLYLVVSPELNILTASKGYLEATNNTLENIQGKYLTAIFSDSPDYKGAQAASVLKDALQRVLVQKKEFVVKQLQFNMPAAGAKGLETKFWQLKITPVLNIGQEVVYILICIEDVTQQHQAENYDAGTDERFNILSSITIDAMWDWDLQTNNIWRNDGFTKLFGYGESGGHGAIETWTNSIHPEDYARVTEGIQAAIERADSKWEDEYRFIRADGSTAMVHDRGYVLLNEQKQPYRMIGAMTDVTATYKAREALAFQATVTDTIATNATACLCMLNAEGKVTYLNPAAEVTTGWRLSEIEGKLLHDVVHHTHPDGTPFPMQDCTLGKVFAVSEAVTGHEDVFIRKDGSFFPVMCALSPLLTNGELEGAVLEFRDITEQKKIEEEVRQSAERFKQLAEAMPQIVFTAAADGTLEYYNRRWTEYTGLSVQESLEKNLWQEITHEEDRESSLNFWQNCIKTGEGGSMEFRIRSKNGHYAWFLSSVLPFKDQNNQIQKWYGTSTNIHALKELQYELKSAKAQLEEKVRERTEALEEAQRIGLMGSWSRNLITGEIEWSEQMYRIFGIDQLKKDELLMENLKSYIHPEDVDMVLANSKAQSDIRENDYQIQYRIVRKDGELRYVESRGHLIRNNEGDVVKVQGTVQDITAFKTAEQALVVKNLELERSNHELEQFAYVASHDLKEPLRMVSSYSQLLVKRFGKENTEAQEFCSFITEGVNRMQALINDLLVYSQVGRKETKFLKTDLNEVLAFVEENLHFEISESGAQITAGILPFVSGNHTQLVQLFQNLIGNAVKFRRKGVAPKIEVTARNMGKEWLVAVKDNGIGMEQKYEERVFNIFQRLHQRNEYPGTGIGLAICKKIVNYHGGRIWLESKPDHGTTFFVTIPK